MPKLDLIGYHVSDTEFCNRAAPNTRIQLQHQYSYNVKYAPNCTATGEMTVNVTDKEHPEQFHVKAVMRGIFRFEDGSTKEELHTASFRLLFPYLKAYVATLTVNAGIPPVQIPMIDIDAQNIYRIDMKNPNQPES